MTLQELAAAVGIAVAVGGPLVAVLWRMGTKLTTLNVKLESILKTIGDNGGSIVIRCGRHSDRIKTIEGQLNDIFEFFEDSTKIAIMNLSDESKQAVANAKKRRAKPKPE